jgi:unsaturated rhamnogalacturonyl hydrolase
MDSKFETVLQKVTEFSMTQFDGEYEKGSWGKGLLLYGLIAKYIYDNDEVALNFARKWVEQAIESQTPEGELGNGDPSQTNFALIGLSVLFFANRESQGELFSQGAQRQADYYISQPLNRSDTGAIYYLKKVPQIWADTVVMVCPFLIESGVFFNMPQYTEEAIRQLELHIQYLKDTETGLYRHIWDDAQKRFYDQSLWGRGNGWMLVSLIEVAEHLAEDHPKKHQFVAEIKRLAELLILCQDEEGFWRIFLDQISEISKSETAGTLIIAYGLSKAIRNGWIDLNYAKNVLKSFDAVISCVKEDGFVANASGPTLDPRHTPYNKPYPHAQGFFLITTLEISRLLQFLKEKEQ